MQGLGGLAPGLNRGASMSGNRATGTATGYFTALSPGQTTWTAPNPGWYKITGIGGGGGAKNASAVAGGGGAAVQKSVLLARGAVLTLSIGRGGPPDTNGANTTITLPDGTVLTAGGGVSGNTTGAGGAPSGGDINVTGNAGAGGTGGDGPTIGDFIGVPFVTPASNAHSPGIGCGGSCFGGPTPYNGGNGAVYINAL